MTANQPYRQDAWTRRDPCLPNDCADLTRERIYCVQSPNGPPEDEGHRKAGQQHARPCEPPKAARVRRVRLGAGRRLAGYRGSATAVGAAFVGDAA